MCSIWSSSATYGAAITLLFVQCQMPSGGRPRKSKPAEAVSARATTAAPRRAPVLDPIITMDASGVIQSASDSVEHLFGWTPIELLGRNVKELIPEPRRSNLDRYLDRYRLTDKPKSLHRVRRFAAQHKDGTIFQIELSMSRAELPPHTAPFFIGIIRDVTNEIDVGADTVEERSRVQMLVTEQTRALATANLRLQLVDRMAAMGTLAAGLGHDMNNVLLPIRARLDALEHAGMGESAMAHIMAVRRSVAYLQQLSDGLHFLAMDPDGLATRLRPEESTDLAEWWKQVGDLLRKAVPQNVVVTASIPRGMQAVTVAPQWLTQAMLNLIVNAGEAIPARKRGGRVKVWATPSADGQTVNLGVTDNGSGMTPEIRRRAMDLFFTTKPRSMGTGLGLPLARKVADRAGGSLQIKSKPNAGTTVVLTLRTSSTLAVTKAGTSRTARISIRNPRVTALVSQVLIQSGLKTTRGTPGVPGNADAWVTDASAKAMKSAAKWRKGHPNRALVLVGSPSKANAARWAALGAKSIPPHADFEAIRHTIGQALSQ
jgi:PAS domain S-box-containing protein